ncbi:hypothetical protein POTOM_002326 [Populus tomentosa]|uniref:Uncharacterized protein n=1 Tax=Populus tomentosa TaxID=118781 RepID=A0A8X8DJE5_POPTO|nr:hypothetical protein POTOM_002326 [Populus tomentosa]
MSPEQAAPLLCAGLKVYSPLKHFGLKQTRMGKTCKLIVPVVRPPERYLSLLKLDGKLILMGVINAPLQFVTPMVMHGRKSITGSFIGSMKETEEMLEYCKEKGLTSMIEVITMDYINMAFERLEKNDVRYRFAVDVAGSKLSP